MVRFISLGSGSSGNCYVLQAPGGTILIDAGVGVRNFKKFALNLGLNLEQLRAIFVTHDHADHVKAAGAIANKWRIPVYATARVHQGMTHSYHMRHKLRPEFVRPMKVGERVELFGLSITSFAVPHDSSENVGYDICFGTHTLCVVTDAGCVTPEMMTHMQAATYLVLEANHDPAMLQAGPYPDELKRRIAGEHGHLSNGEAARVVASLARGRLRHVWLCHLSQENNTPQQALQTVEQALEEQGLAPGKDVEITVLNRRTPTPPAELD